MNIRLILLIKAPHKPPNVVSFVGLPEKLAENGVSEIDRKSTLSIMYHAVPLKKRRLGACHACGAHRRFETLHAHHREPAPDMKIKKK